MNNYKKNKISLNMNTKIYKIPKKKKNFRTKLNNYKKK